VIISKYNFLNQCYNNIVKLIIDPIPTKHNMPKELYQSKKIVINLCMSYEKIDVYEKIACDGRGQMRFHHLSTRPASILNLGQSPGL
jgi:hypothetical protein